MLKTHLLWRVLLALLPACQLAAGIHVLPQETGGHPAACADCERTCTITDGSAVCGCNEGEYLKPDAQSCWNWQSDAERLQTEDGTDAETPRVATNRQGTAVAVWSQSDGMQTTAWASRYTEGAWDSPSKVGDAKPYVSSANPHITVADSGDAVALWNGDGKTAATTLSVSLLRGETWRAPEVLASDEGSAVHGPVLAGSAAGAAVVAWSRAGHGTASLEAWTFSEEKWTAAHDLLAPSAMGPPSTSNVQLAMDRYNNAVLLWHQVGDSTALWIRQKSFQDWEDALQVQLAGTGDFVASSSEDAAMVAMSRDPVVVWLAQAGATKSLWASMYHSTWSSPYKIRELRPNATLSKLKLASDAQGNVSAIWLETDEVRTSVWSSRLDSRVGYTWLPAMNIEAVSTGDADSPDIALEANGSAIAVWSHTAQHSDIWANRFFRGSWGTATRIETQSGDAKHPSIALDEQGNALAVWEQTDGEHVGVFSNRFD